MKPKITESAKEIICHELNLPGVHSVILIGSRARGDASAESDYDVYVVTPLVVLPFVASRIKKIERSLNEKLKVNVSISPLTYSRMKRGKDTLVFHTKNEGIILCGRDIKPKIRINSLKELPREELFQYLFDSIFYLIKPIKLPPNEIDFSSLARASSKTILYCANLRLMCRGIYAKSWKEIVKNQNDPIVREAYQIITTKKRIKKPFAISLWFKARRYALETLRTVFNTDGIKSLEEFSTFYLSLPSELHVIRGLQILILSILYDWIQSRSPISFIPYKSLKTSNRYMHILTLYLASSILPEFNVENKMIKRISQIITNDNTNYNHIDHIAEKRWQMIKEFVEQRWKVICGKSII